MTYPCTDCILDHMAASGPQHSAELRRECRTQAVPYSNDLYIQAVDHLLETGRIVYEADGYYDFPESYYNAQI